jgi:hypothetical protein
MKISIEVECTPDEARQFLGLPDMATVRAAIEERMRQAVEETTPESLLRTWLSLGQMGADEMTKAMDVFLHPHGGERT